MSQRPNAPMPSAGFGLLLVEGGDEEAVCKILAGPAWTELRCCNPHATHGNPRAAEDKGWLRAYLGMISDPALRFHQAFEHRQGIDATHAAFASLRAFILAL